MYVRSTKPISFAVSEIISDLMSVMIITITTRLVTEPSRVMSRINMAPSSSFSERWAIFSSVEKCIIRKVDRTYKVLAIIHDRAMRTITDGIDESMKNEAIPTMVMSNKRWLALM
jgi:vacuolar-type H+-ATPase subunit F/Vma7